MALEIVGIFASLVSPAIKLGKSCFKKPFNYLCCIKTNIKDLQDAVDELKKKRDDLQNRVDAARRDEKGISSAVETWLREADDMLHAAVDTGDIKLQIIDPPIPGILRLKPRYSRSRKAKKTAESMKLKADGCKFKTDISTPPPAPARLPMADQHRGAYEFVSRKQIEDDIIKALRDGEVKVIGVCGMGGVGKTTMAKQIMYRAREKEGLFDEVAIVVVSQQADMLKIQDGIADFLSLGLTEKTLAARANRLQACLKDRKKTLIVIDDIWEIIDLVSLGIPRESGSCSILLTSRDISVLNQMVAPSKWIFMVKQLNEEDAWSMFKENAGDCLDDSNLLPIAREVAKECNGLPLAIVAVARALKGNLNEPIWEDVSPIWNDALRQLRIGKPTDIPGVIDEVYNPIRYSYDFLKNENAKSLLFLCSFLPEDYDISTHNQLFMVSPYSTSQPLCWT